MSTPPRTTEYSFTLPVGYLDAEGVEHREGAMRLATARDEIEPLRDARVRDNGAYLSVLKLARVLTRVGSIEPVTPALVEQLYAADFAHLTGLYEQLNSAAPAPTAAVAVVAPQPVAPPEVSTSHATPPQATARQATSAQATPPQTTAPQATAPQATSAQATPPQVAPTPRAAVANSSVPPDAAVPPTAARPPVLAGVSEAAMRWMLDGGTTTAGQADRSDLALPIGLRQDRERAATREALMRSPAAPRRGRVLEGSETHPRASSPDASPHAVSPHASPHAVSPHASPHAVSPHASPHAVSPHAHPQASSRGISEHEPSRVRLMRLGTRPPAHDIDQSAPGHPAERSPASPCPAAGEDLEDIYEQMIARLRRELLVERERMGASPGE